MNANDLANQSYDFVYSIPGCSDTTTVVVNPKPQIVLQDLDAQVCAFDSVRFVAFPAGGTWAANDPTIATIDPVTGWATGVSSGTATFTYTVPGTLCSSISPTLTVNPPPVVTFVGSDTICVGTMSEVTPQTGGSWVSSDPTIATIDNAGQIDGLTPGRVELRFTDDVTGCTSDTLFLQVIPVPEIVFVGNDSLCVGGLTQLEPSTGGTWTSSNPAVASVSNTGVVQGIIPGTVTVTYTDLASGCVSEESPTIWILDAPTVSVDGDDKICIGETSSVTSNGVVGTWVSNDTLIATIDSISGEITATGFGQTTFTFTETATGCSSETGALIVDSPPTVNTDFSDICIGQNATLSPNSGGTWTAYDTDIASLSNGNIVTGVSSGTAAFIFNSDATGCDSDTLFVTVTPGEDVETPDDAAICIGENYKHRF